jgi:hypothetical protein
VERETKAMNETPHRTHRTILWSSAAYFAACGLSAIAYPQSWLFLSGLSTNLSNELSLTFGVIGAYLLALAFGATIAALAPHRHPGLILTLAVGNILDFAVTLKAVVAQQLPIINGGLFLAITIGWAWALSLAYLGARRGSITSDVTRT